MTTTRTLLSLASPSQGFLKWRESHRQQQLEIGEFLTLGRDAANDLIVQDEYASLRHSRIERKANGFLIRDLRSRNGTYLNGTRIFEAQLNDGDRIRVGQSEYAFSWRNHSEDIPLAVTSKNAIWQAQLHRLTNVARSPFPVLLIGPSGTGKDVLAQALHRESQRRGGPLVSVNCSALSEALVESELFGHIKGSFTGATADRKGAFEAARGGSLFLDEIGDLPLGLQPKLLRALENNQVRPVGSDRAVQADVRILAATHHDLKKLVDSGRFREDLFFRLNVVKIQTPPLSERMEDFEDLFYRFAKQAQVRFSFAAIARLKEHKWPGNIRELKNVVARAKAFWSEREIGPIEVNELLEKGSPPIDLPPSPKGPVIKEIELEIIKSRLIANHGNQRKTAIELGIAKSTLHDRIKNYGIDLKKLLAENS